MSESKAMILGCAGTALSAEDIAFYRGERPWGFILFARNVAEPRQIRDLVAAMRDCVGWQAPVFIDQEGGRVQRTFKIGRFDQAGAPVGLVSRHTSTGGAGWKDRAGSCFEWRYRGPRD